MAHIDEFEEFYKQNEARLVARIATLVDHRNIAEEISQEAFHKVWQRWDELEEQRSYLYSIALNRAKDELRKRRTRRSYAHLFREADHIERIYLDDALEKITPRQKAAIYLRFYGDKTHGEVAELMDIPTGTVKSLIHRGLNDLRTCIN